MKVLLVGDNRTSPNWGGRAVSIALHRLLSERHTISGVLTGLQPLSIGHVNTLAPANVFRFMESKRGRTFLVDYYLAAEKFLGARDAIDADPGTSAERILRYHARHPELAEVYEKVEQADAVVINAEGDLVFTTPPRRVALFLLAVAQLALQLGKRVYVVNALVADCPIGGRNHATVAAARRIFSRCEAVLTRDPESLAYVSREMPEANCHYVPDAAFLWFDHTEYLGAELPGHGDLLIPYPEKDHYLGRLDLERPYICVGGSAGASAERDRALSSYRALTRRLAGLGFAVYVVEADGPDSFLEELAIEEGLGILPVYAPINAVVAVLANARLLVSGRYHPTILASLGGTPCVFLSTTSHKMSSLQRVLEYPELRHFTALPGDDEIGGIVTLAGSYLAQGDARRHEIRRVAGSRSREARRLLGWLDPEEKTPQYERPTIETETGAAK